MSFRLQPSYLTFIMGGHVLVDFSEQISDFHLVTCWDYSLASNFCYLLVASFLPQGLALLLLFVSYEMDLLAVMPRS